MDNVLGAGLALLVVAIAFTLMIRSWRRREQRDAAVRTTTLSTPGAVRWRGTVMYLATTSADAALDRRAIRGLGYRGRAELTVFDAGVRFAVAGEAPVDIPAASMTAVGTASWTIDRGVGSDGLIALRWRPETDSPLEVESTARALSTDDHIGVLAALRSIYEPTTTASEPT